MNDFYDVAKFYNLKTYKIGDEFNGSGILCTKNHCLAVLETNDNNTILANRLQHDTRIVNDQIIKTDFKRLLPSESKRHVLYITYDFEWCYNRE